MPVNSLMDDLNRWNYLHDAPSASCFEGDGGFGGWKEGQFVVSGKFTAADAQTFWVLAVPAETSSTAFLH